MSEYKFYDWSFARISGVFGGLVYVFFNFHSRGKLEGLLKLNWFLPSLFVFAFLVLLLNSCIFVSLGKDLLYVRIGFLPILKRKILVSDIVKIKRENQALKDKTREKEFYANTDNFSLDLGKPLFIYVTGAKNCVIYSRKREEILSAVKKIRPDLEIS